MAPAFNMFGSILAGITKGIHMTEQPAPVAATEPQGPPAGIVCPSCSGTAWAVTKTATGPGRIVRYRQCAGCEKVIRTREVFEATPRPRAKPRRARTT
jgi:hypothetical protein